MDTDRGCTAGYDNQDMEEDVVFDGGYQVPGGIYSRLFDYQKTGELPEYPKHLHQPWRHGIAAECALQSPCINEAIYH